jgi:hypothetical protein
MFFVQSTASFWAKRTISQAISFWGAQAASLFFSAALPKSFSKIKGQTFFCGL